MGNKIWYFIPLFSIPLGKYPVNESFKIGNVNRNVFLKQEKIESGTIFKVDISNL